MKSITTTSFAAGSRNSSDPRVTRIGLATALALWLLVSASTTPCGAAESPAMRVPVGLGAGSLLWLEGKSTLHDFESRTTQTSVVLMRDPTATQPTNARELEALIRGSGIRGVEIEVPVLTLRSEKSGLDKNLWRSLKAQQFPTIRFRLSKYTAEAGAAEDTLRIRAEGTLDIAGVQRPDTLNARAYRSPQGLWIVGSEPLLMSAFGITPPKMMMGTLRVSDRIVVRYRLLLVPKSGGDPPSSSVH